MYDGRGRRRAGELGILREDQQPVFLLKRAVGDELFTLGYDIWIALGGWAFFQYGSRTVEHGEAVRSALASPFGLLDAAEEYPAGLGLAAG
jgi:hypothetical protein